MKKHMSTIFAIIAIVAGVICTAIGIAILFRDKMNEAQANPTPTIQEQIEKNEKIITENYIKLKHTEDLIGAQKYQSSPITFTREVKEQGSYPVGYFDYKNEYWLNGEEINRQDLAWKILQIESNQGNVTFGNRAASTGDIKYKKVEVSITDIVNPQKN